MNKSDLNSINGIKALRLVAARRLFADLTCSELPEIARSALGSGLASPSLKFLAGELHPTQKDSMPLFEQALIELGIPDEPKEKAGIRLALFYAHEIVSGSVTPYDGARNIWGNVATEFMSTNEALWQQLVSFVGYASEWEDDPDNREHYEKEIVKDALELINQNADFDAP